MVTVAELLRLHLAWERAVGRRARRQAERVFVAAYRLASWRTRCGYVLGMWARHLVDEAGVYAEAAGDWFRDVWAGRGDHAGRDRNQRHGEGETARGGAGSAGGGVS